MNFEIFTILKFSHVRLFAVLFVGFIFSVITHPCIILLSFYEYGWRKIQTFWIFGFVKMWCDGFDFTCKINVMLTKIDEKLFYSSDRNFESSYYFSSTILSRSDECTECISPNFIYRKTFHLEKSLTRFLRLRRCCFDPFYLENEIIIGNYIELRSFYRIVHEWRELFRALHVRRPFNKFRDCANWQKPNIRRQIFLFIFKVWTKSISLARTLHPGIEDVMTLNHELFNLTLTAVFSSSFEESVWPRRALWAESQKSPGARSGERADEEEPHCSWIVAPAHRAQVRCILRWSTGISKHSVGASNCDDQGIWKVLHRPAPVLVNGLKTMPLQMWRWDVRFFFHSSESHSLHWIVCATQCRLYIIVGWSFECILKSFVHEFTVLFRKFDFAFRLVSAGMWHPQSLYFLHLIFRISSYTFHVFLQF